MKIAVFGDSFADYKPYTHLNYVKDCWIHQLEKNYEVSNFAENGSGLMFSYNTFKNQNLNKFDKIIFLVSNPRRLLINSKFIDNNISKHVNPYKTDGHLNHIKKASESYIKYFENDDFLSHTWNLVLDDIRQTLGDRLLLLKVFSNSTHVYLKNAKNNFFDNDDNTALYSISMYEDSYIDKNFKKSVRKSNTWEHFKVCHLTGTTHAFIYRKINNWLQGNEFSLEDYVQYIQKNLKLPLVELDSYVN